jgi:hypothetical protein
VLEPASERAHPLGHAAQPKASTVGGHWGRAVVGDLHEQFFLAEAQADAGAARLRVAHDVGESLLHHTVGGELNERRQGPSPSRPSEIGGDPGVLGASHQFGNVGQTRDGCQLGPTLVAAEESDECPQLAVRLP